MKKNRVQAVLPDDAVVRFEKQAALQGRTESNLARIYIMDGLKKDEDKQKEGQWQKK